MLFRTVVQDGLIVVNTHGVLPDGTTVEITVPNGKPGNPAIRKTSKGRKRTPTRRASPARDRTPGFGMWADRSELGGPEDAVDRLRALTRRRRVG